MAVAPAIREAFENHIKLVESRNSPGHVLASSEASFFVGDLNDVIRKWAVWKEALPDVTPFYGTSLTPLSHVSLRWDVKDPNLTYLQP
jgi:hypothetical protein